MKLSASSLSTVMVYQRLLSGNRRDLHPNLGDLSVSTILSSMDVISGLGFDSFELYVDSEKNLSLLLEDETSRLVVSKCRDLGLKVGRTYFEFLPARVFDGHSYESIEGTWARIGRLSSLLETGVVEMVSPALPQLAPESTKATTRNAPPTEEPSWDRSWETFVFVMAEYAGLAAKYGLKLAIEPRPREILNGTDSLLRLLDRVPSDNLGGVVDISHLQIVREIPSVSIRKLNKKVFSVHLSDNDGVTEWHWAPGQGQIEWALVINALRAVGYDGLISLDVSGIDVRRELVEGKQYVEEILAKSIAPLS
jgi:sugar phosphate isomerase/epimerase